MTAARSSTSTTSHKRSRCCRRSRSSRGSACATSTSTCTTSSKPACRSSDVALRPGDHGSASWVVSGGWCDFFHRAPRDRARRWRRSSARWRSPGGSASACCGCSSAGLSRDAYGPIAARDHRSQPADAVGALPRCAVRVREPRRRVARPGDLPRGARRRRSAEHPHELRPDQLREGRRASGRCARRRCAVRRRTCT